MQQIQKDLLICMIGSEQIALDMTYRFRATFPQISVHTEGMMGALVSMSQNRFRVVVIATTSEAKYAGRLMVRKTRELGYSPNDIFLYCGDSNVCDKDQSVVDAYAKGNEDNLLAAARKAAQRDIYCRWLTQEDIDRAAQRTAERMADLEVRALNSKPIRRPWIFKVISLIKRR